jgi:hypothetical protein
MINTITGQIQITLNLENTNFFLCVVVLEGYHFYGGCDIEKHILSFGEWDGSCSHDFECVLCYGP